MKRSILVLIMILVISGDLHADFFKNNVGIKNAGQTVAFDELGLIPGTIVTDEYSEFGVSFAPNMWQSPQDDLPGIGVLNFDDQWLGNFFDITNNPVSILFENDVTAASFSIVTNDSITSFNAYLDGNLVESADAFTTIIDEENFVGFEGIVFDEIEIVVDPNSNGALGIDNLRFNAVPEPTTGAVLIFGFAALAVRRNRR